MRQRLKTDERGYAVVEATILFPILIMIFAGLVLLAMYLPTRAVLQRATQYAATAIATEQSDTWLTYDESSMQYSWFRGKINLPNVYIALLNSSSKGDPQEKAETIVEKLEADSIVSHKAALDVECRLVNYLIYKEFVVTATQKIPSPVDLSFVGFPKEIPITVSSTAVVQNGDEFVRNIDLAADFIEYLMDKYNLEFKGLSEWLNKAWKFLGI